MEPVPKVSWLCSIQLVPKVEIAIKGRMAEFQADGGCMYAAVYV